jgi:hypothetical protein
MKQSELESETAALRTEVSQQEEGPGIEVDVKKKRLERRVPSEPALENLLRTLQEIELVSGSKILDYSFTYDGTIPERAVPAAEDMEIIEETEEDSLNNELEIEPEEREEEVSPVLELPGLPEEAGLITVAMELFSPDYEQLQVFLQEIEKQERVMMISYLEFVQPGEMELLESGDESVWVNMEVTSFYYEG